MKLRVKLQSSASRHSISVEAPTDRQLKLQDVKVGLFEQLPPVASVGNPTSLVLSLDGKNAIANDDSDSIEEVGLVAGDLVHVLNHLEIKPLDENSIEQATADSSSMDVDDENTEFTLGDGYSSVSAEEVTRILSQPRLILCADYIEGNQLPPLLSTVFATSAPETKFQFMVVVLHSLLLEKGFLLNTSDHESSVHILPSWKKQSASKVGLTYVHSKCEGVSFSVVFVNMFESIVLVQTKATLPTSGAEEVQDEATSDSGYVSKFRTQDFLTPEALAGKVPEIYQNLCRLSQDFTREVVVQLLSDGVDLVGGDAVASIHSLPYDAVVKIFEMLDFRSLSRMSIVSKFYRELSLTPHLWKNLFVRDFSALPVRDVEDWKEEYRNAYILKRAAERRRFERMPQPFPLPSRPFYPLPDPFRDPFAPPPFSPPGFFGGDEDPFRFSLNSRQFSRRQVPHNRPPMPPSSSRFYSGGRKNPNSWL